ncbi:MAG: MinD/ParA family protein [Magnetospiraceae bacterium]
MTSDSKTQSRSGIRSLARRMIAVASGKGGVGKTWLSITLAHALARRGQRVLLFDGDLGLANVDIQLGLMPQHDLGGVLAGKLSLNQASSTFEEGGFDIISGRSGSGGLANVPVNRLQVLGEDLHLIAAAYDHVILDLGAGVERTVRYLAQSAGTILVVTTDEPTSLTDAYAFIKVTHMDNSAANLEVVVNMAESERSGEKTYNTLLKACQGFLKMSPRLAGIVQRDTKVRDSIRSQTPVLVRHPTTQAALDVEKLASDLMR